MNIIMSILWCPVWRLTTNKKHNVVKVNVRAKADGVVHLIIL